MVGSLGACADPVIVDPIPDGGVRADLGDGGTTPGMAVWSANPAAAASLTSEGPAVDARRQLKRDPHFFKDSSAVQYLFISGSIYTSPDVWSVSYFTQPTGSFSNVSTWAPGVAGTPNTWYSGDITGPAIRITTSEKVLFFAANASLTDQFKTRPDYVFQIGRAPYDGVSYKPTVTPVLSVPTFSGTTINDTPMAARPDAYGAMDPWIVDDGGGSTVTMYYAGLDCTAGAAGTCKFQILRSVSTDGGLSFPPGAVVLSGRPGNPEEAGGVAGPSVVVRNGKYILAYTAVKTTPTKDRYKIREALVTGSIGVATSSDGMTFFNAGAGGAAEVITRSGSYREQGCSSPSLYQDVSGGLHSYFAGYYNVVGNGESYNIATADFIETTN